MGKWTRRALISSGAVVGGGLIVGVALRPGHRAPDLAGLVTDDGEHLVNVWVKIANNNQITAIVPHSEMGQGAQTALTQMLADELGARWQDVSFIEAPAEDEYANWALGKGFVLGDANIPKLLVPTVDGAFLQVSKAMKLQITGGSASIRATGVYGMRVAGAAARESLIQAAADAWQVPAEEIIAEQSELLHPASNNRAEFGKFAEVAAAYTPSRTPKLKNRAEFKIMGQSVPRLDIPSKVDGTAKFALDANVPGMKYAAIVAAPVFGATVQNIDATKVLRNPNVHKVVDLGDAVAVVADGYWHASRALRELQVSWNSSGHENIDSTSLFARFEEDLDRARSTGDVTSDVSLGDAATAFASANNIVEATYHVPYLAHACMEPMNATAKVDGKRCEVWVGAQNPLGFKHEVAEALGFEADNVRVHQHYMGGGFGRRANADVAVQAAKIAAAAEVPVKLIWSREEDMQHDHYRPAVASKFKAAIDNDGTVVAWDNLFHEKSEPDEAPSIPYKIANQSIQYAVSETHVPLGPWRSVDHSQHGFFTEGFFDEVTEAAGRDPYELRKELLAGQPRLLKVLNTAAQQAQWSQPLRSTPESRRGKGISLQSSFGSIVAQVVEVTVAGGKVKVDRVVCAVDPGFAVSPDGVIAQMESGIIYGLSAALYGDIQLQDGRVVQSNFHDYQVVRMHESPIIETHIINSGEAWGGAGEPGTPGIAPALANAVFAATGTRIRQLPLSKYDLNFKIVESEEVIGA